tara:strand:+ start:85 stop:186 length:102 start_codon:yes stop_codon:yes gene_type:complete
LVVEDISDSPKEQKRLVIIIDKDVFILGKECLH